LIYIITMMKKEEYLKAMGKRLLATREKSRVLQGDLAKQLDISRVKLYRLENGEGSPDAYILYQLSTMYDISPDWLVKVKPICSPQRLT
jgi:transcriptional regulator with XRE-family HTH domain